MKHAEKLVARILFLEGIPIVGKLKEVKIGAEMWTILRPERYWKIY